VTSRFREDLKKNILHIHTYIHTVLITEQRHFLSASLQTFETFFLLPHLIKYLCGVLKSLTFFKNENSSITLPPVAPNRLFFSVNVLDEFCSSLLTVIAHSKHSGQDQKRKKNTKSTSSQTIRRLDVWEEHFD